MGQSIFKGFKGMFDNVAYLFGFGGEDSALSSFVNELLPVGALIFGAVTVSYIIKNIKA